jgi:flagellar biosynthesis component FlhA
MIWIALVLVIAIFLFFLCRDPGATMGCIFVVFIVICLIVGCFQSQANKREREEAEIAAQRERDRIARKKLEDMVKINVSYDTSGCPANYPLLVTIANHSAKTVQIKNWT